MTRPAHAPGEVIALPAGRLARALVSAALVVLGLLFAARVANSVFAPLVFVALAGILAMALNGVVVRLQAGLRLPRPAAAALVVLVLVAAVTWLAWLLVPMVLSQAARFSQELPTLAGSVQTNLVAWAKRYPALAPLLEGRSFAEPAALLRSGAGTTGGVTSLVALAGAAANALFSGVLFVMLLLFLLMSPEPVVKGLLSGVPAGARPVVERTTIRIGRQLGAWLAGTVLLSAAVGVLTTVAFALVGFDNALLFGLIAAVTNLIPVVGPVIGLAPPALVAVANGNWPLLWWALGVTLAIQQVQAYVAIPIVFGRSLDIHPASLIVGILLFGALLGIVGIFLTVPLLVIVKALYEEVYLGRLRAPAVTSAAANEVIQASAGQAPPPETASPAEALGRRTA